MLESLNLPFISNLFSFFFFLSVQCLGEFLKYIFSSLICCLTLSNLEFIMSNERFLFLGFFFHFQIF